MEYLLSAIWSALEIFAYCLICHCFFQSHTSNKRLFQMFAILWIATQLYLNSALSTSFQQVITVVLYLSLSKIFYKCKWYQHLFAFLFWYVLNGAIDIIALYGFSGLRKISFSQLVWEKTIYVSLVTSGKCLLVFISWLCSRFWKKRFHQSVSRKWLGLSLLFPGVSAIFLWLIFFNSQETMGYSGRIIMIPVALILFNVLVTYYIHEMEKSALRERDLVLLHRQMEIQSSSLQALEKRYREQRKATHEFRSQLQMISGLLAKKNLDAATNFVEQILGEQTSRIFPVNTHNSLLDALLNQKYQTATEHDIDIQFQVSDLSQLPLGTEKMVVLLSNLLDNGIEGCCRVEAERMMYCKLIQDEDIFEISVRNTSPPVIIVDNMIPTSKAAKHEHGYGLPQIRYIINDFHGTYAMNYSDGWFTFVAEIPLH